MNWDSEKGRRSWRWEAVSVTLPGRWRAKWGAGGGYLGSSKAVDSFELYVFS